MIRQSYNLDMLEIPSPPARVHFVGIGGVGMSGLARIMATRGYQISGSDQQDSPELQRLANEGFTISVGHHGDQVGDAALLVVTAAAPETNPEIEKARQTGIPVVKRAAMLGYLSRERRLLAVAGSHGKSTTAGMAALALDVAGLEPSFAVGAEVRQLGTNARPGEGEVFIAEADEYDYSFLWLEPEVAVVTNIEYDHPDLFSSYDAVLAAFEKFARRIRPGGTLVLSAEDRGCWLLASRLADRTDLNMVTIGERVGDWQLSAGDVVVADGERTFELRLSVPGRHNRLNALAVLAAVAALGIDPAVLLPGLADFRGVGRRFEILRDDEHLTVVDDYAHHPTEITATITAARGRYPGRRLVAIFQPHTFSRTRALLREFADALGAADEVIVSDIYAAREPKDEEITAQSIVSLTTTEAVAGGDLDDTEQIARRRVRSGDVVLVMGAGDIYRVAQRLAEGA